MKLYIDFGGTNFKYLLEDKKREIERASIHSSEIDLIEFIESLLQKHKIDFIGISFAGQVNNGEVLSAPNIKISQTNIKDYFENRYNTRVEIENDLKCAVLAEAEHLNVKNIIAIYIGTGFGSAYIDGTSLIQGANNLAGEIGHTYFKEAPFKCGCGKSNCLELFTSGIALKKWSEYYKLDCEPTLEELKKSDRAEAKEIVDNFYQGLSISISNLVTILNPSHLVLGGGVIKANLDLVEFIRESIENNSLKASSKDLKISLSELNNGALDGAKLLENLDDR